MASNFTKREFFTAIKALVTNEDVQQVCHKKVVFGASEAIFMTTIADFCDHEIELLDKKHSSGSRKPTKTQVENEGHKAKIIEVLTALDHPATIKEIQAEAPELSEFSTSKMSALLTALIKTGVVERTLIKRVAHFSMAATEEATAE